MTTQQRVAKRNQIREKIRTLEIEHSQAVKGEGFESGTAWAIRNKINELREDMARL